MFTSMGNSGKTHCNLCQKHNFSALDNSNIKATIMGDT
jgi:hypothetical protein